MSLNKNNKRHVCLDKEEHMRTILIISFLFIFSVNIGLSQDFKRISKSELEEILKNPADKLFVVNFWATWCAPCVNELPDFQKVVNETKNSKVEFMFISLDFPSSADKTLTAFLKKNKYNFKILLLTETDYDSWINTVDKNWQGNIPATLFFNRTRKIHHFIDEPLDKTKLDYTIKSILIN